MTESDLKTVGDSSEEEWEDLYLDGVSITRKVGAVTLPAGLQVPAWWPR